MSKVLDELKAENAALRERIEKFEEAAKPAEPSAPWPRFQFDPTAGASMSPAAMREMMNAVPDRLMSELAADSRKPNPVTGFRQPQSPSQVRGTGWRDEIKLEPPPGISILDKLMDAQDKIDRVDRELALAKAALAKKEK